MKKVLFFTDNTVLVATGRHVSEEGANSLQFLFVPGDFAVLLRAGMSVKKALFFTVLVRSR